MERGIANWKPTDLLPIGSVRNVLSVRPRGCTADEPHAEQDNGFFLWSKAKQMVPATQAVRVWVYPRIPNAWYNRLVDMLCLQSKQSN